MFYYKHIDIDNNISEEMKEWGLKNIQKTDDPVVKLDVDKFKAEFKEKAMGHFGQPTL